MTPIRIILLSIGILMVLLSSATPATAYASELGHPCIDESRSIGGLAQVVEQLRSLPTNETSGKAGPAVDGIQRKAKLTRRAVVIMRFLVCMVRELSRELIENTLSIEKRR